MTMGTRCCPRCPASPIYGLLRDLDRAVGVERALLLACARAHVLVRALGLGARGALGLRARGHERQLARLLRLRAARVLPNEKNEPHSNTQKKNATMSSSSCVHA